jgi:hypothetical protein
MNPSDESLPCEGSDSHIDFDVINDDADVADVDVRDVDTGNDVSHNEGTNDSNIHDGDDNEDNDIKDAGDDDTEVDVDNEDMEASSTDTQAWQIAIRWIILHSVTADVELARLSNVCRSWRRYIHNILLTASESSMQKLHQQQSQKSLYDLYTASKACQLLLPSMVRHLLRKQDNQESPEHKSTAPERFCAAWFPSEGIQALLFDPNSECSTPPEDFFLDSDMQAGTPGHLTQGCNPLSSASKSPNAPSLASRNKKPAPGVVKPILCCPEWRGYRQPYDVLRPFGYAITFVKELLRAASSRMDVDDSTCMTEGWLEESDGASMDHCQQQNQHLSPLYTHTTWAVRGATVARAERYCLCYDHYSVDPDDESMLQYQSAALQSFIAKTASLSEPVLSVQRNQQSQQADQETDQQEVQEKNSVTAPSTARTITAETIRNDLLNIRQRERVQIFLRRKHYRHTLQRDNLPLIVPTKPAQQKSLVFLNSENKHACSMMTPSFACGPLTEPVTIFMVGIATEDGCFWSGLNHRFEMGHLHPADAVSEATQLSAISIATELWSPPSVPVKTLMESDHVSLQIQPSRSEAVSRHAEDSSADDEEEDEGVLIRVKCECVFQGGCEKFLEMSMEDVIDDVYRGRTGPGTWHCYVAIFDGSNSKIRVDGQNEYPMRHQSYPNNIENIDGIATNMEKLAMLDGLTLGSDHCFAMPLCCGQGSNGEGEGAIAEIVVFSGRLDEQDIQAMESHLMQKHGIPHADPPPWNDSEWERKAQALIYYPQTPPLDLPIRSDGSGDSSNSNSALRGVPLQYLSRHRAVSWKRSHPVSGRDVVIQKIGSKLGASSSDW